MSTKAIALRRSFGNRIEVLVMSRDGYGGAVGQIDWVELRDGDEAEAPTFTLDEHAAQELIDSLWTAGIRPTEGRGSAGQLGATERHLEDMRRLVFADRIEVHASPRINVPPMREE